MRAGKQNDIKTKLDELAELPEGFHFNQEAVWQKMEPSLDKGQFKRKRIYGLYAASIAALCLVAVSLFFIFRKTGNKTGNEIYTGSMLQNLSKRVYYVRTYGTISGLDENNGQQKKAGGDSLLKHLTRQQHNPQQRIPYSNPAKNSPSTDSVKQQLLLIPDPVIVQQTITFPPDSNSMVIAKPKRKFRISHINELEKDGMIMPIRDPEKERLALFKRKRPPGLFEDFVNGDERTVSPKKPRTLLSLISTNQ
jgi:hypothetical protein